jgi:hypothetical protein
MKGSQKLRDAEWLAGLAGLSLIVLVVVVFYWGFKAAALTAIGLIAIGLFHLLFWGAMLTGWLESRNAPSDHDSTNP